MTSPPGAFDSDANAVTLVGPGTLVDLSTHLDDEILESLDIDVYTDNRKGELDAVEAVFEYCAKKGADGEDLDVGQLVRNAPSTMTLYPLDLFSRVWLIDGCFRICRH